MKQFESFGLDASNECLWRDGEQITLPPKPFAVLRYLVDNPGRLITHDELLDALWPETYVQPQVLRTYMLDLRRILGDDADKPRFIQTLPKRGYCFIAAVTEHAGNGRAAAPRIPAPDLRPIPIVNREEELAGLQTQAQLAANGRRQLVFVTGEAGIGKSALVEAFCQGVHDSGAACVATGQCVEGLGEKEEYYPVMEALRQLCASRDGQRVRRILARMAPGWLPALGCDLETADGAAPSMVRMPGDLCAALEELALEYPLILVFEDVHWADDSTRELISALARRRSPARLMLLATCRLQEGSAHQPLRSLKHDLVMRRLGTEIALAPLARSAVYALLVRQLAQSALPEGLDAFVFRHSEGNPLFVIAILEHLIAQGVLARDDTDRWHKRAGFPEIEAGVPDELAQMLDLEIQRLNPAEQRILEAASLMSIAFPAWAVAAALEEDAAAIEEACDELARRLYFVHRAGSDELPDGTHSAFYVFAHGLYREVLYARQSSSRRARRHIRIAERLGELFRGREANVAREMATHFEAAHDWKRASDALRTAAQRAQQRRSHAEAAELLESALRVAHNLPDRDREVIEPQIQDELGRSRDAQAFSESA